MPVLLKLALDCKKTAGTKIRRPEIVVRAQEGIEIVAPALTIEATKGNKTMTREVQRFRILLRTIKMIAPKIDAKIQGQGVQLADKEVREMMAIGATGIIETVMEVTRAKCLRAKDNVIKMIGTAIVAVMAKIEEILVIIEVVKATMKKRNS